MQIYNNFQKAKNIFAIYIKIKYINLNIYLHFKNVLNINNLQYNYKYNY